MNVSIKLSARGQTQARKKTIGIQILYPYDIVSPFAFKMREIVVTFITSIGNNNCFALDGRTVNHRSQRPSLVAQPSWLKRCPCPRSQLRYANPNEPSTASNRYSR